MSYPFGITGIGTNPYMNGLANFGLPAGGAYSSFDYSPYSSTMMGYPGMMGYSGMMGMYNPAFMAQMNTTYQDIEKNQLSHAGAMHDLILQNKTDAFKAEDTALFRKAIVDNSIHGGIEKLSEKIKNKDSDGICQEFDNLKLALYRKYNKELKANEKYSDPEGTVVREIENLYSAIMSKEEKRPVTLRTDIMQYGEGAFMHGFNKAFLDRKDYHEYYTEETLKHLYGTRIDNKVGKDRIEGVGSVVGKAAELASAGAVGTGAGMAAASLASVSGTVRRSLSVGKVLDEAGKIVKDQHGNILKEHTFANWFRKAGKLGVLAGVATLIADGVWQWTR